MDQSAIVTLGCFIAAQTGALIFFAGSVWWAIRDHARRIEKLEADVKASELVTAELKGEVRA